MFKFIFAQKKTAAGERIVVNMQQHDNEQKELEAQALRKPSKGNTPTETIINKPTPRTISRSMSTVLRLLDQSNIRDNKGTNVGQTATSKDLEPDDFTSLIKTHGGKESLHKIIGSLSDIPYTVGDGLCVCGNTRDKHVDRETAASFNTSNPDNHLEIHEFTPQRIGGQPGNKFRASQSKLLDMLRPVKQEDGSEKSDFAKVFDSKDVEGDYLPMTRVGTKGIKFNRYETWADAQRGRGQQTQNFLTKYANKLSKCIYCGFNGKKEPNQRDNSTLCGDCEKGKITLRSKVGADGKKTRVPFTIGLGGGKQKYFDEEDAPACKSCEGKGSRTNSYKTGETQVECSSCSGSGKDTSAFSCTNCHSDKGSIPLTPDNTCPNPKCNEGYVLNEGKAIKPRPRVNEFAKSFMGNPRFATLFRSSMPANTGVDTWKAHGDKDCTRCHGDDEHQTEHGLPCNCRIGSFEDTDTLPSGMRLIHPEHVDIPDFHYLRAMSDAYDGDLASSPHEIHHMPNLEDPETNKTPFEQYGTGSRQEYGQGQRPIDQRMFLGVYSNGKRVPKSVIDRLNVKSKKNWSSANAKYCASSADLADLKEELKDIKSWPDVVAERKPLKLKLRKTRVNEDDFPESIKTPVSSLESAVGSLSDSATGKYNDLLDTMHKHLTKAAIPSNPNKVEDMTRWRKLSQTLLSEVGRSHGESSRKSIEESISNFPSMSPKGATSTESEEATQNV